MSKTSLTEAGQIDRQARQDDLVESINQIFTLFRVNFHNQYYKAYPDVELVNQAKKLWLGSLKHLQPKILLNATKRIIEEQEYLPTLHQMLATCAQEESSAPAAHQAYVEACNAPSPKASYNWSHPAVYEAGKRTDWFFLSTTPEQFALPVFRGNYEKVLTEIGQGMQFEASVAITDASPEDKKIDKQEGLDRVKALRSELGL